MDRLSTTIQVSQISLWYSLIPVQFLSAQLPAQVKSFFVFLVIFCWAPSPSPVKLVCLDLVCWTFYLTLQYICALPAWMYVSFSSYKQALTPGRPEGCSKTKTLLTVTHTSPMGSSLLKAQLLLTHWYIAITKPHSPLHTKSPPGYSTLYFKLLNSGAGMLGPW